MKSIFTKYLVQGSSLVKGRRIFTLTEDNDDATVTKFEVKIRETIYKSSQFIIINCEELINDMDRELSGNNFNSCKSDYAVIEYKEGTQKVYIYLIELGPHTPKELEQKFNASFSVLTSIISRYFQKERIFQYTCHYRLFHYDLKLPKEMHESQANGYVRKSHKNRKYNYFCFSDPECSLSLLKQDIEDGITINSIENIFYPGN